MATTTTTTKTHHKVVALQTQLVPLPDDLAAAFPAGHTFEVEAHAATQESEVAARVRDADIVVITTARMSAATLAAAATPHLRMISVVAAGVDSVDAEACRRRGIHVANSPAANAETVAEHALGSYFAVRRRFAAAAAAARSGGWVRAPGGGVHYEAMPMFPPSKTEAGQEDVGISGPGDMHYAFPLTCRSETLGIVGYGAVGRRMAEMGRALGMRVLVAGRRGEDGGSLRPGRTEFARVLREATVLVLCVPRTPETLGLIGGAELAALPRRAVLVNVSRGGVVDEDALAAALRARRIAGAAVDVYVTEPGGPESSPLLAMSAAEAAACNLLATPHVAWCSDTTFRAYHECLKLNIRSWLEGSPTNTVV